MNFITLSEAATLSGKTLITIRRLAKKPSSAPYVKSAKGKLYIDKAFVSDKYADLSTQEGPEVSTQSTQDMSSQSTQDSHNVSTQNESEMSTQGKHLERDLSTQALIDNLRKQYEGRIQDLKESLKEKQREVDRITTLFSQQQQIEMARVASLPAKSTNYEEAETVHSEPTPATAAPSTEPIPQATEQAKEPIEEEIEPSKKRWWWPW